MVIKITRHVGLMLNSFATGSGLLKTYSPRTSMMGKPINVSKHCNIPFVANAQTHKDRYVPNKIDQDRTEGGICLGPTGNFGASYSFLSLGTGRKVKRSHFYEVPTPGIVI